ncbi:MAG: dTDP-4-amino-4,6-dideoxygalactose transaminase [Chthoniobacteraceae bacterium]|nr:dTDP-4-amino-4,6-dideoxygalactose transaminase [Chthoniobacteraceae bacterium]
MELSPALSSIAHSGLRNSPGVPLDSPRKQLSALQAPQEVHPAIPFNRPSFFGREMEYIGEAMQRGHAAGDGFYTGRCQRLIEEATGVQKALLTTSCTHALEMCGLLLELQAGDEVIVPSFTFVTTANAFALRGAKIVFADICPDTLNIDPACIAALITPRTKAIVVVHYAGVACSMDAIVPLAAGIPLIEDNAHGLFGKYRGRQLGTFGALATQSFHETKNLSCGEGGALLINDPRFNEAAEIIREKGTDRSRFLRGQVDKYTWTGLGSSYVMADLLAAILYGQLESREEIAAMRRRVWHAYQDGLAGWARENGVKLPHVPPECEQTHHMFYLILPTLTCRQALIAHLRARSILSVFHYQSLHCSPAGLNFGGRPGQCPVTENVSDRLLRLPFYNGLAQSDQARVIEAVLDFRC